MEYRPDMQFTAAFVPDRAYKAKTHVEGSAEPSQRELCEPSCSLCHSLRA